MNPYPVVTATITCFSTLIGGIFATKYRDRISILAPFAAGILIATSLLDILPETLKLSGTEQVSIENVMAVTVLGFIFLYAVGRYIFLHPGQEKNQLNRQNQIGGFFATSELSAHSFLDGLAIGLGFEFDLHVGLIIALAVICHDFSDGLSTVTVMLNSGNSLKNSLRMLFLDAVAPVAGALVTFFIQISKFYLVLFLPFFAGGFLYLGASDLLPQAQGTNPRLITLISNVLGFAIVFLLSIVLGI